MFKLICIMFLTQNTVFTCELKCQIKSIPTYLLFQGYLMCEADKRFLFLFTFLRKNGAKKKIMVFFSACNVVKFYYDLLNYVDLKVECIHVSILQSLFEYLSSFNYCGSYRILLREIEH